MSDNIRTLQINRRFEYRFKAAKKRVAIRITRGRAEIFGAEMEFDHTYNFENGSFAVYTWHGCQVEVTGNPIWSYITRGSQMMAYLNTHHYLEDVRCLVDINCEDQGPVALVVGPPDVGKATVTRTLLNYASRCGRSPLYVDLDVAQGRISVPGTVGAVLMDKPPVVEGGFSNQDESLIYNYGHISPWENIHKYMMILTRMAKNIFAKGERRGIATTGLITFICAIFVAPSGIIINMGSVTKEEEYTLLKFVADTFSVNNIIIVGSTAMYFYLLMEMQNARVSLVPQSVGIAPRTAHQREESRVARFREYYYGKQSSWFPYIITVDFDDFRLYGLNLQTVMDESNNYSGYVSKLISLQPRPAMMYRMVAVTQAAAPRINDVMSQVAGFLCIVDVDMAGRTVTVMSPWEAPLPPTVLLLTTIIFFNSYA